MIQVWTGILIKDNSGFLQGNCINSVRAGKGGFVGVGNFITVVITKSKIRDFHRETKMVWNNITSSKGNIENLLIIQTNKSIRRYDGSIVKFNYNCGVSVGFKGSLKKRRLQLGFKRINTTVPFELRKRSHWQAFRATYNIIKLAKNLI